MGSFEHHPPLASADKNHPVKTFLLSGVFHNFHKNKHSSILDRRKTTQFKKKELLSVFKFIDQFFVFLNNITFICSHAGKLLTFWSGGDNVSVINLTETAQGSVLLFPLLQSLYLLCRSHLWHRHRLRGCGLNHFWSIYSCTLLCHWHSSVWLSVCCSVSESDVWNRTAPPSPPLMRSIDGEVSSAAGHDLWQKTERDSISWTWWQYCLVNLTFDGRDYFM